MIKIRSITYNLPPNYNESHLTKIKENSHLWNLERFFVRTKRITLTSINDVCALNDIKKINKFCNEENIRWFNLPIDPWTTVNKDKLFRFGANILKNYENAFVNIICIKDGKFNQEIIDESIKMIKSVSKFSKNGKDNFRLGLSANIESNCPFFPFAVSSGDLSFSIGLELTQEINKIISANKKLNYVELREKILEILKPQIEEILITAQKISNNSKIKFCGFDFSLSPINEENGSVITILKQLGITDFSSTGTMFVTSYLTNILKFLAANYPSVGFSGVMYSLLEDLELCRMNNEQGVKLEDLIKLSTMCGCGIDMVPITEDTSNNELKTAIIEIGAISTKLKKPLGIRFLPIPHTKKNEIEYTNFYNDADFIANTKVLTLKCNELIDNNLIVFEYLNYNNVQNK